MSKCLICNEKPGTNYQFPNTIFDKAFPPGTFNQGYKIERVIITIGSFCPDCLFNLHHRNRRSFWGKLTWGLEDEASLEAIAYAYYLKNKKKIYWNRLKNKRCEICGAKADKQVTIDYYAEGLEKMIVGYSCLKHTLKELAESKDFSLQDSLGQFKIEF